MLAELECDLRSRPLGRLRLCGSLLSIGFSKDELDFLTVLSNYELDLRPRLGSFWLCCWFIVQLLGQGLRSWVPWSIAKVWSGQRGMALPFWVIKWQHLVNGGHIFLIGAEHFLFSRLSQVRLLKTAVSLFADQILFLLLDADQARVRVAALDGGKEPLAVSLIAILVLLVAQAAVQSVEGAMTAHIDESLIVAHFVLCQVVGWSVDWLNGCGGDGVDGCEYSI